MADEPHDPALPRLKKIAAYAGALTVVATFVAGAIGGTMSLIRWAAHQDTVTKSELKEHDEALLKEMKEMIRVSETLSNQRIDSLAEKIDGVKADVKDGNVNTQGQLDRILNLLLVRPR